MSNLAKFHKVTSLPLELQANAFYLVSNGSYAETYITDSSWVAKMVGNSTMINDLIDSALADMNTLEIVANITERNSLVLTKNTMVLVIDATGDSTVTSWSALYAYKESNTSWIKLAEYESMDVTISWANIQWKPSSSVADIDDAVNKKHSHANLTELNKIWEDGNQDFTYNWNPIWVFNTNNW